MLKWLRTGNWPSLEKILSAIRQELQSVQPIDTASIRWEKDAEGMRAYYTGKMGGGMGGDGEDGDGQQPIDDDYNGKFKVGKIDDKLYIYDGSNKDNAYAGTIVAGSSGITFPKTELALVDGDVYVILKWTPEDDDTSGSWSTHVHQGEMWTSPYYNDPRAAHFLVASVVSERVTQQHKSGNIIVTGRWV